MILSNQFRNPDVWVVIPAAGVGSRMGAEIPKQYLRINSKTILEHTIECFLTIDSIVGIVVVVSEEDPYWPSVALELSNNISNDLPIEVTTGGVSRADTVVNGLNHLRNKLNLPKKQWVMVHDAARPCVTVSDVQAVVAVAAKHAVGALLAAPVTDTLKRANANLDVTDTLDRSDLYQALTPQVFRMGLLQDAILLGQQSNLPITDESSALELAGFKPRICAGARSNIKITFPEDLILAESFFTSKGGGEPKCV
mgnify:CR=1 FL=1